MKLVVAGGTGFLGSALVDLMRPIASEIVVLSRSVAPVTGARIVTWDGRSSGAWAQELNGAHAVVNYCGSPIFCRWTRANRERILTSRVDSTRAIGNAVAECAEPPRIWINGSATGYYGNRGSELVDEDSAQGRGFLAEICRRWEESAIAFRTPKTVLTLLRTGIVLDPKQPPLSLWLRLTKMFLGGRIGNGHAFVPWIGLYDHANLVRFCIERMIEGPINAVAPIPVSNGDLMRALRKKLGRPPAVPVPAAVFRLAGTFGFPAEAVLMSTLAAPSVAARNRFEWSTGTIAAYLKAI